MNSQIKKGAIISYIALFANIIIGLVYSPWVIRSIGKSDYGLYTLALSIISIFVFDFGLGSAVTRFISKYNAENRQDKVDNFIGVTLKLYLLADIVILVILSLVFILIPMIYKGLSNSEIGQFEVIFIISATFSVASFPFIPLNGILTAYEEFVPLKLCDLAHKLIIVILMSICLLLGFGLYALVIVNAISGVITIILKLLVIKRKTPLKVNWLFWDKAELKNILSFSVWVMLIALCQRCVLNLCPSILGIMADSSAIAVFGVSVTLEGLIFSFANAINGMFLPRVSRMVAHGADDAILDLMIRVGRIQIFIICFLCVGFLCVGQKFIHAWLGVEYNSVYLCVILLVVPSVIYLPQEIANTTVVAKNEVKYQAKISFLKAASNLLLAFPLVKFFGVYGMAFSVFISYTISITLMNVLYKKRLNIDIGEFFRQTFLKIMPALFASTLLSYLVSTLNPIDGWTGVILTIISVCVIYIPIMVFGGLNKDERMLIFSPIYRFLHK